MEILLERCAGLDVHKKLIVACVRIQIGKEVVKEVCEFGTTTRELCELGEWLASRDVTHVAMEATGVFWRPVWHILEGDFALILANPAHIKNVPGRKTDVKDAEWIAMLLAHGLIEASMVPPAPIQESRDLTRTRKQLRHEVTRHTLRIQKTLENANIKLASVLTDITGVSGRAIINALIQGETNPTVLADLATGRAKKKHAELREALYGRVTPHHRFLLRQHVSLIEALERSILDIDRRLEEVLAPFREKILNLSTIPGVSDLVAEVILAEIGADMSCFPSEKHLRSWACLCPRNDQSAGKRRSTRIRKGATALKTVLVQAAWAASRAKGTYLQAQFRRICAKRGAKKAAVAVASSILTAAYFILRDDVQYHDLGPDYFDRQNKQAVINRHLRRLKELGCDVQITSVA